MNYLSFHWSEPTALSAELIKPIAQISLQLDTHGRPMNATLWRTDGTGLRIQAEMHDVAERREVGVLKFSCQCKLGGLWQRSVLRLLHFKLRSGFC
jgi:hypothetical protein